MGLSRAFLLLLLGALEVRGHVGLPVARGTEDLFAVRARERAHACKEEGGGGGLNIEVSKAYFFTLNPFYC